MPTKSKHEVGAPAVRQLAHRVDRLAAFEHVVRAELHCQRASPRVGVDGDGSTRSELSEQLQRDVADAADADHDRGRARRGQMPEPSHGVVGGEACVGVRRDRGRLDAGGKRQERPLGHEDEVGEPAVDRQPGELVVHAEHVDTTPARDAETAAVRREHEHCVALRDGRHTRTDLLHPARVLVAEDARQRHSGRLHEPLDGVQIGRADTSAADPHEHVRRTRDLRRRPLDELERLVVRAHECRFHGAPFGPGETSSRR